MGENEFNNDEIVIKNMTDGSQLTYSLNNVNSISF
jgi:histidyl-tRNA synthetase